MKKAALILTAALVFSSAAFAQSEVPELDAESCRLLVEHQAKADVAHKPAVDVNGKPVVEADLHSYPVQPPEEYEMNLNIDTARYGGLSATDGAEALAHIGKIVLDKDGNLTFNGAPMEGQAEAALRALCVEKGHNINGQNDGIKPRDPKVDLLKQ